MTAQPGHIFYNWLLLNWSRAGLVSAIILLAISPLLITVLDITFWTFLQLPIYMIHQYEEHAHGAFKKFINGMMGEGSITDKDILVINLGYVWLLTLICSYLSLFWSPFFGLIPIYLVVINGLIHVANTVKLRAYNPGLWTSLALFLPVGGLSLVMVTSFSPLTWTHHLFAIAIVMALHAELVIRIKQKRHYF